MASRVVLHIGAMKSGTSFVQNVVAANAELLASHGWLWPGASWTEQVSGVLDLIEHGSPGQEPLADDGPWRRLAAGVNAWDGDALISMEFLGPRSDDTIATIVGSFPDTVVDVVLTARDLSRQLPAMWQESVQNRGEHDWPGYVEAVRRYPEVRSKPGRSFWRQQSFPDIVERWTARVGRDHLTLVTVPAAGSGAGSGALWERFVEAAGLPADLPLVDGRRNSSIGSASAMVLRDLNVALDDALDRGDYDAVVKHGLAKRRLAERTEPKVGCDEPWLAARALEHLEQLRHLDPRVVGDLDDLLPHPVAGMDFAELTTEDRLDAATDALAHVVRQAAEQRQEIRRLKRRLRRLRSDAGQEA